MRLPTLQIYGSHSIAFDPEKNGRKQFTYSFVSGIVSNLQLGIQAPAPNLMRSAPPPLSRGPPQLHGPPQLTGQPRLSGPPRLQGPPSLSRGPANLTRFSAPPSFNLPQVPILYTQCTVNCTLYPVLCTV